MSKLTDEQALRKGVELAPGWGFSDDGFVQWPHGFAAPLNVLGSAYLAALAADLVDMVDGLFRKALCAGTLVVRENHTYIHGDFHIDISGPDRRMNTIHAVVAFFEAHPELAAQEDKT